MKILITTFGTRGDIQPYVALGMGLKQAGHEVAVCTSEGYQTSVEEHGLCYAFMDNELLRLTQASLSETSGPGETFNIVRQMAPAIRRSMDDEWRAAQNFQPDLILYHPKCLGSLHVAEKMNLPALLSLPLPFYTPTRAFPVPFMSGIHLGSWFNRFSYQLMGLSNGMYASTIQDFRGKTLGMPPVKRFSDPLVRSDGSPHLLPVPEDFPAHVHVIRSKSLIIMLAVVK